MRRDESELIERKSCETMFICCRLRHPQTGTTVVKGSSAVLRVFLLYCAVYVYFNIYGMNSYFVFERWRLALMEAIH